MLSLIFLADSMLELSSSCHCFSCVSRLNAEIFSPSEIILSFVTKILPFAGILSISEKFSAGRVLKTEVLGALLL